MHRSAELGSLKEDPGGHAACLSGTQPEALHSAWLSVQAQGQKKQHLHTGNTFSGHAVARLLLSKLVLTWTYMLPYTKDSGLSST